MERKEKKTEELSTIDRRQTQKTGDGRRRRDGERSEPSRKGKKTGRQKDSVNNFLNV